MLSLQEITKSTLLAALVLLGSAASARAQNDEGPCSDRTLQGKYGFSIEGMILSIPGAPALPAPLLLAPSPSQPSMAAAVSRRSIIT